MGCGKNVITSFKEGKGCFIWEEPSPSFYNLFQDILTKLTFQQQQRCCDGTRLNDLAYISKDISKRVYNQLNPCNVYESNNNM